MHRIKLGSSGVRLALVLVAAVFVALVVPSTAFAATGHITGKVVDDAYKAPLAGIAVRGYVYDPADPTFMDWVGDAWTDADGTYDLEVPPGQIIVEFTQDAPNLYLSEFYNNTRSWAAAGKLTLASGATLVNINASLGLGSRISGTVTDQVTGAPLEGIRVTANYDEDNNGETFSRTDGTYDITGLPSNTFQVAFQDIGWTDPSTERVYVDEWYNSTTQALATNISLTAPATRTGVNASMVKGASIAGTVTQSGSGKIIYAEDLDGYSTCYINVLVTDAAGNDVAWDYTDAKGKYHAGGLPAGTYKVKFFDWGYDSVGDPGNVFYTTQWYNNKSTLATANAIVLSGTTAQTGVNAALVKKTTWGSISGTAYDANDTMRTVPGAVVTLYFTDDGGATWMQSWDVPSTRTDALGNYRFDWVPAGTYRVLVNGGEWEGTVYPDVYGYDYLYYGGTQDLLTATSINLPGGGSSTGKNVYLPRMPGTVIIGGTLTNATTAAVVGSGVPVGVYTYGAIDGAIQVATAVTDSNGQWRWPVYSGDYKLAFNENWSYPLLPSKTYVGSWYNNAAGEAAATVVSTILGGPTLVNDELAPAFHFVGTVTGPSGGLEGATVSALKYVDPNWEQVSSAVTAADGSYDLGGLPTGSYKVQYDPPWPNPARLATEFYDNKVSLDHDAGQIVLSGAASTQTLNANLAPGVEYKGRVFLDDSAANLDQDIKVHIWYNVPGYGWNQVQSTYGYNSSDGQWWMRPMPTGSYKFQFDDPYYRYYQPLHYLNHASFGDLDVLSPAGGSVTVLKQTMDGLPPVTSSDAVGGYKGDAVINFTATDAIVGVASTHYAVDGGSFTAGTSVTVTGLGPHSVEYYSVDNLSQAESVRTVDFEILPVGSFEPVPISGATRIDTAIAAAETAFPTGADTVVIATAYNWPDALGGAALAGAYDGPILLTSPSDLPATVAQAITDLGASKAVILGGPPAVGAAVESELDTLLGAANVTRVAGSDRYKTAEAIAAKTVELLGAEYDGMAFVSTGANFPDALAASPLAAAKGWPIYLVDKNKPLQTTTRQAMQAAGVTDVAILGGTTVVPTTIEGSLKFYFGTARVERLAGSNRYQTGCIVAEYGVQNAGLSWNRVAFATGQNFPDALAGGVLQGRDGSVMLLTPSASLDPSVAAKLTAKRTQIEEVRYLGGLNAVSQAVRNSVQNIIE